MSHNSPFGQEDSDFQSEDERDVSEFLQNDRARSDAAFTRIAQRYQGLMHEVLAKMRFSPADADDAVQNVLLQASRKLHQLQDPNALPSWLKRVTVNMALVERRRAHHTHEIVSLLDEFPIEDTKQMDGLKVLMKGEESEMCHKIIRSLPDIDQQTLG